MRGGGDKDAHIVLEDEHVQIVAALLRPTAASASSLPSSSLQDHHAVVMGQQGGEGSSGGGEGGREEEGKREREREGDADRGASVVYICRLPMAAGRFDPLRAKAAGVKPGRKYSLLQSGCEVTSDDGLRTVSEGRWRG